MRQDERAPAGRLGSAERRIVARFAEIVCPPQMRAGNLTGNLLIEFESLLEVVPSSVRWSIRAGPFGCNTPVAQNGLDDEWLARPTADAPKRYAFFGVEPASPDAPDEQRRGTVFLDYSNGDNRAYDIARILRDYLVRVEPGSDELLLGKACFVVAGTTLAHSYFIIERYRPLTDASALAKR
jgi:hypothetical protein